MGFKRADCADGAMSGLVLFLACSRGSARRALVVDGCPRSRRRRPPRGAPASPLVVSQVLRRPRNRPRHTDEISGQDEGMTAE